MTAVGVNSMKGKGRITGTIEELQNDYARHCGYKTFEELTEKDEEALRIWYLKMLEPTE